MRPGGRDAKAQPYRDVSVNGQRLKVMRLKYNFFSIGAILVACRVNCRRSVGSNLHAILCSERSLARVLAATDLTCAAVPPRRLEVGRGDSTRDHTHPQRAARQPHTSSAHRRRARARGAARAIAPRFLFSNLTLPLRCVSPHLPANRHLVTRPLTVVLPSLLARP